MWLSFHQALALGSAESRASRRPSSVRRHVGGSVDRLRGCAARHAQVSSASFGKFDRVAPNEAQRNERREKRRRNGETEKRGRK